MGRCYLFEVSRQYGLNDDGNPPVPLSDMKTWTPLFRNGMIQINDLCDVDTFEPFYSHILSLRDDPCPAFF